MCDGGAAFMAAADFTFGKMYAVGQDGAFPDQPVMIVDVEVISSLRKELGGPFDLAVVFRDVRLHQHIRMLAPQAARRIELRRCTRSGKARRDCVKGSAAPMPARDQRLRLVIPLLRRVAQFFRSIAV